ncbi:hypothetical protein CCE08_17845 [Escherichia coli]|nr:hypothetical protein CCE08_17845 [Escherichia coli]
MLPIVSPSVVTKQLAFNRVGDKRKVRVSSNFLDVMGFKPGNQVDVMQHHRAPCCPMPSTVPG